MYLMRMRLTTQIDPDNLITGEEQVEVQEEVKTSGGSKSSEVGDDLL